MKIIDGKLQALRFRVDKNGVFLHRSPAFVPPHGPDDRVSGLRQPALLANQNRFNSTVLPPSSRRMVQMIGSPGYANLHFLRTRIASKKNDIYSYGVILLELITGREALSSDNNVRLISKVGPVLKDVSKVAGMMDCCLAGEYEVEEAMAMASLAASREWSGWSYMCLEKG